MKKIINGKIYDTKTAIEIDFHSNNLSYSDFNWCDETLYRKKNTAKEFFLYGKGGAMSSYAHSCSDGTYTSGEKIVPISHADAKEWMENYSTVELYEEVFGKVEE